MIIGKTRLHARRVLGAAALVLGLACGSSALLAYSQGRGEGAAEVAGLRAALAEAQAALKATEARLAERQQESPAQDAVSVTQNPSFIRWASFGQQALTDGSWIINAPLLNDGKLITTGYVRCAPTVTISGPLISTSVVGPTVVNTASSARLLLGLEDTGRAGEVGSLRR